MRHGLIAALLLIACSVGERAPPTEVSYCAQVASYQAGCAQPSACTKLFARDCDGVTGVLEPAVEDAAAECMRALGEPVACVAQAVDAAAGSPALGEFVQRLCLACGDGAGSCESEALLDGPAPLQRAVRIARALRPDLLDPLADRCASMDDCAETFESCAIALLADELAADSAACIVAAAIDGEGEPACGDTGTHDDAGDETSSTGGGDGETSDANTSDGGTDDGGGCTHAGCDCDPQGIDTCDGTLTCVDGICTAPSACTPDTSEPNDVEPEAAILPMIGDDDTRQTSVQGQLDGDADVDWYQYQGADYFGSLVNPYAAVNVLALEVCLFAECLDGLAATSLACPEGTTQQPSPGGRPGCCASGTTGFEISLSCGFTGLDDDSAIIAMRVSGGEAGLCQDYTLTYHF